jgi:hypothetical protein
VWSDDDDSVSSNSEEHQPSASRDAVYFLNTNSSNFMITKCELSNLIGDLEFPKIRHNFQHQIYNSGIYYNTP